MKFKIDTDRVFQYKGQRIVDTVTLVQKDRNTSLVYSPYLNANVRVYNNDLKQIVDNFHLKN